MEGKKLIKLIRNKQMDLMLKHRSKDETRYFLCGVNYQNGELACSDSRRIAIFKNDYTKEVKQDDFLPEGNYKILTSDKYTIILESDNGIFPNYKKRIPEINTENEFTLDLDIKKNNSETFSIEMCKLVRNLNVTINYKYLLDLIGYNWTASYLGRPNPIRFDCEHSNLIVLIQPMMEK